MLGFGPRAEEMLGLPRTECCKYVNTKKIYQLDRPLRSPPAFVDSVYPECQMKIDAGTNNQANEKHDVKQ